MAITTFVAVVLARATAEDGRTRRYGAKCDLGRRCRAGCNAVDRCRHDGRTRPENRLVPCAWGMDG
ncbi:hypothetical protein SPHINGO391_410079 [Sphingomonas aurantiaca]|uniref:Uncharacterized protein n=1 Tax=Sphingomonas aurantiaca TaxID=185949 RepID=A0A5E7YZ15_9SPHN|nr:hypothetical protein SPHINGO391_410079 [Sphingomonas aurantiaca]